MGKRTRQFMAVMAGVLAGLCIVASAHAEQSFLIINNSGCIQWIQIKNANGSLCVTKGLAENADVTIGSARGTGISLIQAGPTPSIDDCCYARRINASVSLDGANWRIDINPAGLKVIDRNTYQEVFYGSGDFSRCVPPRNATSGIMGVLGGQPQQPLTTRGQ